MDTCGLAKGGPCMIKHDLDSSERNYIFLTQGNLQKFKEIIRRRYPSQKSLFGRRTGRQNLSSVLCEFMIILQNLQKIIYPL